MKELYLECYSGISGDMFVAAMLQLGADRKKLETVLATLPLAGFKIKISQVKKNGLDAYDFDVLLDHELDNHDHDMEYLFGHDGHDGHDGHNEHDTHEDHEHHHHMHRGIKEIRGIISGTAMTEGARALAMKIFTILGEAEAAAHGTTLDEVHFHEVGAVDSIVDIISAAVCFDDLGISRVIIPVLYEGMGQVHCAHGLLPIPVPAVSNIIAASGLKLHITGAQAELVTPTGAAIAAAIRTEDKLPENFSIEKLGIGAGKREYENPSLLRAMIINTDGRESDVIYRLESNIDDCTGENLGYVMDVLMKAGARDVNYMPVFMKKNRPAYQLNVICAPADVSGLEKIIFRETTTIGIRRIKMERSILKRDICEIKTSLGTARVKVCEADGEKRVYPEYDSVADICERTGKPFGEVFSLIEREGVSCVGRV